MSYQEAVDLVWGMLSMLLIGGILLESVTAASKFLYGMGLVKKYVGVLFGAGLLKFALSVSAALIMLYAVTDIGQHPNASLSFSAITLFCQLIFFGVLMPRRIVKLAEISMSTWWWHVLVRPLIAAIARACGRHSDDERFHMDLDMADRLDIAGQDAVRAEHVPAAARA